MSPLEPKKPLPSSKAARAPETHHALELPGNFGGPWAPAPDFGGGNVPPAGQAPVPSMGNMAQALRRRWPVLAGLGLVGAGLMAAALWFLVPRQYVSQTLLEYGRPLRGTYEGEFDLLAFKRTQAALVKSGPVLQEVLHDPEVAALPLIRAQEDPYAWLEKNLVTDELLGPGILRVTLTGDRPQDLPVVLNAVTRAYLSELQRSELKKVETRKNQLRALYKPAREELRRKRERYSRETARLGVEDPGAVQAKLQMAQQKLTAVQAQLLPKELEMTKNNVELKRLRDFLRSPEKIEVSEEDVEKEYAKEKSILAVKDAISKIDLEILAYTEVAQPGVGDFKELEEKRAGAERALRSLKHQLRPAILKRLQAQKLEEIDIRKDRLERDNSYLDEQLASLRQKARDLEAEAERLRLAQASPEKFLNSPLKELHDDIEQNEVMVRRINEDLAALAVGAGSPQVTVREEAQAPTSMDVRRQIKLAGAGGLGVFALVFMGVFWAEFRSRRVYGAEDVTQGLGINLVGTLPALPAHTRRPLPAAGNRPRDLYWQNLMTESMDVIRTVLLHAAQTEKLRVVMVTSAVGGEGKTSVASHLAASLARAWRKTLLIDCDLRNPAAHQQFDLPLEPGLSEVLRGEVELEDVIRSTPVSRLWLVPAGKWDSHAIQALAQDEVHRLFAQLKDQFDFIVIDSCPVLPVADSLLIGQHADAALFAVLREVSRLPALRAAHQRLAALDIRMLGAVVVGEKGAPYGRGSKYLAPPNG